MLTRGGVIHAYTPTELRMIDYPGAIRVTMSKGIPQTWAIARPNSGLHPDGSPFYVGGFDGHKGLCHGGSLSLRPKQPRLEMDPSDKSTWRRQYVFTS